MSKLFRNIRDPFSFAGATVQPSTPTGEGAAATEAVAGAADDVAATAAPAAKPKANPFGSARPVDTVSKEKEFEERERRRRAEEEGASLRAAAAPVAKRPPGEPLSVIAYARVCVMHD